MANYTNLKSTINSQIKANGTGAITGPVLNSVLRDMVSALGEAGYLYKGVATPATSPGTPDSNVFYIASTAGTYTNFGGAVVADGEVAILKYNGTWTKEVTGAATAAQVTQLGRDVDKIINGGSLVSTFSSFPNEGRYMPNGTLSQTGWYHTDLIPCGAGVSVTTYLDSNGSSSTPLIIYYDSTQAQIGYELGDSLASKTRVYETPANTAYIRVQTRILTDGPYASFGDTIEGVIADEKAIAKNVTDISKIKSNVLSVERLFAPYLLSIQGFARTDGTTSTGSGYHRTDFLDVSNIEEVTLYIGGNVVPAIVWYDASKVAVGYAMLPTSSPDTITSTKPSGARYMIISANDGNIPIISGSAIVSKIQPCVYLSPTGADNNAGTESAPLATAFGAKSYGAEKVVFLAGDYEDFVIDFSTFSDYEYREGARLICGKRFNDAELASGYTRVYQVAYATSITASFLWQHDVADAATLINVSEYMPMYHCGKTYRLSSTRLYKATSIAEIESTTGKYMWYQTGGVLYFSAPSSDFSTHPIVVPDNSVSGYSASAKKKVNITGLNILYRSFNAYNLNGRFDNGCIAFADATGFIFDSNKYIELNNFESMGCNPDGFGGGATDSVAYNVVMRNCYGHDNADDGESGHLKTCVTQYGGLYEYNGSGVTPAVGAQGAYYGTICRNNGVHDWTVGFQDGTGFSANAGADQKTFILCVGCLSENNKIGFQTTATAGSLAINCVSKNDSVDDFRVIQQVNCVTL